MLKPWILASLGLLAFAALVWLAGPLLVIGGAAPLASAQARMLLIALFALQYLAQKLWQHLRARRTNDLVVSELTPAPAIGLSPEVDALRRRFASALEQLRRTRFGKRGGYWSSLSWKFGRAYLYQLPWYVIIGAPGAGKTTALFNSGLTFPLAEKLGPRAVRGVGGTRNCDWWFTDSAVLIDTAGRYTTHESDRIADRQTWQAFLGLLRRSRSRRPLNGVLLAVSVGDLLELSAEELATHARTLRARLDELQSALHARLPVYVLLTKCDLLPGFVDWFGTLERRDREQVWGITFALRDSDSAEAAAQFTSLFANLVERLADQLTGRLQDERDAQRRGRIFALPRQLRGLGEPLSKLVRGVFAPSQRREAPLPCLRGIYLTSGTQQGTPIDRTLSAFGRELSLERQILPPNRNTGRSFFLSRLLSEVIFPEAELSGRNPLRQQWQQRARLGFIVTTQLASIALAAWWVSGYLRSTADMARFDGELKAVGAVLEHMPTGVGPDPRPLLPALGATRDLSRARGADTQVWNRLEVGARSHRKVAAAAQSLYERLLLGPFQARIGKAIDATLREGVNKEVQYEALKTYTMLRDPAHFEAGGVKVFVMSDWDTALAPQLTALERAQLASHLDALLRAGAVGSAIQVEPALVASVRSRLSAQPAAERIALRQKVLSDAYASADFRVGSLGPAAALFVGADGTSEPRVVARRYTLDVYRGALLTDVPAIARQLKSETSWVLGSAPEMGDAQAQFMRAYRAEYAQAWADLIADVHLKAAANNQEAVRQALALGAPEGPLAALIAAIVRNTPSALPDGSDGPIAASDALAPKFASLARLALNEDATSGPQIESVMHSMREVAVLRTAKLDAGAAQARLARVASDASTEPEPVRSMLLALAVLPPTAAHRAGHLAPAELSREVAARLAAPCVRLVASHFPFARSALRDASLEDFAGLFAPKAGFDQASTQLLGAHVDTSSDTWAARGPGPAPQAAELERFRAAARIREVFFGHGGRQPAIELKFRPLDMDPQIDRFQLVVDGQIVSYAHGPVETTVVRWPGPQPGSARIEVTPASATDPLEFSGPWALFRLLDHAAVQDGGSPGHFRVVFEVAGHQATFDVESDTGANPFRLRELEHFDCPLPTS